MKEIIDLIAQKHCDSGIEINPPANMSYIVDFERLTGFSLPTDFKEFYLTCNGFACNEDVFNMTPISDICEHPENYGDKWFYFSEYMIYSDTWGLRLTPLGQYEIFNGSYPEITITSSLKDFLRVFLKGNVFGIGGLYDWHKQLGVQ